MTAEQIHALLQEALAHHMAGRVGEAEPIYRRVLETNPHNPDALHLMGVLLAQRQEYRKALPLLEKAVKLLPDIGEFHRHLGDTLALMGRYEQALSSYVTATQRAPNDPLSFIGAGRTLASLGRNAEAATALKRGVHLAPRAATALADLGLVLTRLEKFDEAVSSLREAVTLDPNLGEAWTSLSDALRKVGRLEEALDAARRGKQLLSGNPWGAVACIAVGNVLQMLAQFEQAAEEYRQAQQLDPDSQDGRSNLGLTLLKMGEAHEALRVLEEAHARFPNNPHVRANLSLALLALGDFERGLPEYEYRWTLLPPTINRTDRPRWSGEDLRGRTILLTHEQGLGDTIQFVRYSPLVAERGGRVLVSCLAELKSLLVTAPGIERVIATNEPLPTFDVYAPLASLPYILKTTVETIPSKVPYLKADAIRVATWCQRLADEPRMKVGIVWAGSPTHQNDRARSCRLEDFAPLARVKNVALYSLQKGPAASAVASAPPGMMIVPLGQELRDFQETAALLETLDLLVSVDTSVVHLAGMLARPVWTLLPRGADWRWMIDREDSPWYPTMRLFRQEKLRDWASVMQRVAEELEKLAAKYG